MKNQEHQWQAVTQWSDEAENQLGDLLNGDKAGLIAEIEATPQRAQLWKISGPGYAGWLITRIEELTSGEKELFLIAARGNGYAAGIAQIKKIARDSGIKTVRAHSNRKGYERYVRRFGMWLDEVLPGGEVVMRGMS